MKVPSEKELFLGIKFISHKKWKVDFSTMFIDQLQQLDDKSVEEIFLRIYIYSDGYLFIKECQGHALQPFNLQKKFNLKYYKTIITIEDKKLILLISVGPLKIPNFDLGGHVNKIK